MFYEKSDCYLDPQLATDVTRDVAYCQYLKRLGTLRKRRVFWFCRFFQSWLCLCCCTAWRFRPPRCKQISLLRPFIPDTVYDVLDSRLSDLVSNTASTLTFGLTVSALVALYAGSKGVKSLIVLINLAFHISQERGFIQGTIRALGLTLAAVVVLIIAISSIAIIPVAATYLPFPQVAKTVALWSRWPILAGIIFLCFLGLYRLAPNRDAVALKKLVPGALVATVLWIVLSILFSLYVQNFNNYSAEFGVLSAAVVIMLWLYYSAFIVAFGAIFNAETIENAKPYAIRVY